jgi:DNA-directed RNA polymerase beta' subunit
MLKVITEDEREVIATKAKSFLKLINGKIIPCEGSELKVGDYLPVSIKPVDFDEKDKLDLRCILPMNEYVYGSELEKAKSVMDEHHWWMKHANKTFTLPHTRSDSVVQLASDRIRKGRKSKSTIKNGNVYMLLSNNCDYEIPEVIDLDYNFGYLIGAYCAEGCMTKHQISISNNDASYFGPIEELCKKWNITTKIYKQENKNKEGWTSQDIRIYSTLLCRILEIFCGKLSHNKFISDKIIFSNKVCLRGFLDAYIGGDGCIDCKGKCIQISSVSKPMLIDVQQILNIFGIHSLIKKYKKQETNNRGSLDIKQIYYLFVRNKQSQKLASILNMKIDYKQANLVEIMKHSYKFKYNKEFEKIPNEIEGEIIFEDRNDRFTDVLFDKIKSIEEVSNTTNYAYDLTVEKTRNFNLYNLLCSVDTFHLAGVGTGSLVITEGIPRLREIINISKNLKNKNMLIYLKKEFSNNKDQAKKIQSKFAYTQLKDILLKTEIIYDNKDSNTDKEEDIEFIRSYKEFTELFDTDKIDESCLSPWILRLTFDKESLMNRKITIQEIQETIKHKFNNDEEIECIYSDDSVNDVVMRVRIKQDNKGNFLDFMKDFEKQLIELSLRGISNIKQVEVSESNIIKYNEDGSIGAAKEFVLKTNGSNLLDILADDAVDITRIITNDILEFHEIFGIEATRELIYQELYKVYSAKHPNPRHIQLMSDILTYRGRLMTIDRHGLNKNSEIGPIAKASFEEVINIFTKAALFAEKDNMKGVSANILAGQFCKSGTNCFDILMDEEKLLEIVEVKDYVESEFIDINDRNIQKAFDTTYNLQEENENIKDEDFNFGFGIENKQEFSLENIEESNIKIENINIEDEKYNEDIEDSLDFDKISLEEPKYSEKEDLEYNFSLNENNEKEIKKETKKETKKIKVKKTKEEPKIEENLKIEEESKIDEEQEETKEKKIKKIKKLK